MMFQSVAIALGTVLVSTNWAFADTAKTKHDLFGPIKSVTTKTQSYVQTESYDRNGRLTEATINLTHGNTTTHYLFRYHDQGDLLEELAHDSNGQLIYRKQFAYAKDSTGRVTASVAASDKGEIQHVEFFFYDRFGNMAEQLLFHDATVHRSLYDVLGRLIYSARFSKGALFSELIRQYDEAGRVAQLISYAADGTMTAKIVNDYDAAGVLVRATSCKFSQGGQRTWITDYEYDGMGNWTKEVTSEETPGPVEAGSTSSTVQERNIEYYADREN